MLETEVFNFWWLIPLIMIALCLFGSRGCCSWKRNRIDDPATRNSENSADSALEIISKRYARGEIEAEEYEKKRRIITQTNNGETK